MKFDFDALREGKITYAALISDISYKDLYSLTDELFDNVQSAIAGITDAAVTFVPQDPKSNESDERGWTLSHVVNHFTASLEEGAASSAMLARGVQIEGRLRYESPWETTQTVSQLQERLNESRRISRAFLDAWPTTPHLDVAIDRIPFLGPLNAIGAYMIGIFHGQMHLDQIRDIVSQVQ